MAKTLIRKNQLHPDIADLVSGYGMDYFLTSGDVNDILSNYTPQVEFTGSNVVFITGNQSIDGVKNFTLRPTFNGSGLATTGDLAVGTTVFSGNRPISANVPGLQGVTPGGNDVVSFLNNVFYPFQQASITLDNFPIQELGTTITSIDYEGNINPGTLNFGTDLTNLTPVIETTPLDPVIIPASSFDFPVNILGLNNTTNNVFIRMNSKNQAGNIITVNSSPQTIFFEAPSYAGSGASQLFNNPINLVSVLSAQAGGNNGKSVILKPSNSYRQITVNTNGFYYFVYPSSWGLISQIQDAALGFNFNIQNDFTTGSLTLQLLNGANHPYYYYRNTNQITLNNYGVKYYFN